MKAIRYGDRHLFAAYPRFDEASIFLITPDPAHGDCAKMSLGTPADYFVDEINSETPDVLLDPINWLRFE